VKSLKNSLLNIFLILGSIYLPLFFYSVYHLKFNYPEKMLIYLKRRVNEDLNLKLKALKEGKKPIYYPGLSRELTSNFEVYPIGSLPNQESFCCNEGYGLIEHKTDRFGLRNDDNVWNKILNEKNIFFIGDSFTYGECVSNNETIPSLVSSFSGIQSINLGMGGNTPFEYEALLKNVVNPLLEKSKTDQFVIMTFNYSDNIPKNLDIRNHIEESNQIIHIDEKNNVKPTKEYSKTISKLIHENYPNTKLGRIRSLRFEIFKNTKVYNSLTLVPIRNYIDVLSRKFINFSQQKTNNYSFPAAESIEYLSNICKANCKSAIVYIPPYDFFDKEFEKFLKNKAESKKIKFISASKIIKTFNKPDFAPKGRHLSINGYKKVSELIYEELIKNKNYL